MRRNFKHNHKETKHKIINEENVNQKVRLISGEVVGRKKFIKEAFS